MQRQVVDRCREHVGHLLRNQLLRRSHADVHGLRERADRGGCLLAERGVGLVADHELVRITAERVDVSREPRIRLDRQGVPAQRLFAGIDRGVEPLAIALGRQVRRELRDEQAPVGEDQHTERARSVDEAGGRDGLA
jgi:hypothetical protein